MNPSLHASRPDQWLNSLRWRVWLWLGRSDRALAPLADWLEAFPLSSKFLPPNARHAWATFAHLLALSGRCTQAERVLEGLLAHQPDVAAHWFNLGYVRAALGCHARAQAAFEHSLALAPRLDVAWFGLAQALYAQGQPQRAIEALGPQVRLQPLCPDGWVLLIKLYRATGQTDLALGALDSLRAFDPKAAMVLEPGWWLEGEPPESVPTALPWGLSASESSMAGR